MHTKIRLILSLEHQVSYQTTNTYSTLNELTNQTKNVWIACHGIGFLSKYFIKYFEDLNPKENYIIAPQAPSKYYQTKAYKYVGASWLTKEHTKLETENILNYLDAVLANENIPEDKHLILMGFSQGVSVITRWMAKRKIPADRLVIHSGSIPDEFHAKDFSHKKNLKVDYIYGLNDEYLNEEKLNSQIEITENIFPHKPEIHTFDGKHVMNSELLKHISENVQS